MVCDFLSTAALSFHLSYSCKRAHISATPMNLANCEFSLVLQVCFIKVPSCAGVLEIVSILLCLRKLFGGLSITPFFFFLLGGRGFSHWQG